MSAVSNYKLGLKYYKASDFSMAFTYFTKASNMGNRDAKYYLAGMYYAGRGTSKDINKACDLLKELAINGDKDSFEKLYSFTKRGNEKALQSLEELAKSNRSDIQFAFGEIYSDKEDFDKACDWYEKSARHGNEDALQKLAELAKNGNEKALQILENLPQSNRSYIQFVIGEIYSGKEDFVKACDWYEKSALQGNEKALQKLVELAKSNNEKALKSLIELAKNNNKKALKSLKELAKTNKSNIQLALGEIYPSKNDIDKAFDCLEKAVKQGNKKALQKLVELAKSNNEKALQILENLANTNRSDVQLALGEVYASKKDFDKACDCFEKAAKQGNEEALQRLVGLAKNNNEKALHSLVEFAKSGNEKALHSLEKFAKSGNEKVLQKLIELAKTGDETALKSLERLYQNIRSDIQFTLGEIYYSGRKYFDKAFYWYEKSALQNNEEALQKLVKLAQSHNTKALQILENLPQSNRNDILIELREIYCDKEEFEKAAKLGSFKALQKLVKLAQNGNEKALQSLEAVAQNRSDILFEIGEIYANKEDFDKACDWFEKAACRGSNKALLELVELDKSNNLLASKSLEAVAQNRSDIQFTLGEIYYNKGNIDEACYWYEKSAQQKNEKALQKLVKLAKTGNESALKNLERVPQSSRSDIQLELENIYCDFANSCLNRGEIENKNNEVSMNFANKATDYLQIIELIKSMILTEISPRYIYTVSYIEKYFLTSYKMDIENMLTKDLLVQTCRELAQESKIYYLVEAEQKSLMLYKVDSFSDWQLYKEGTGYVPKVIVNNKSFNSSDFILHVYESLNNIKHSTMNHNTETVTIKTHSITGSLINFTANYCHDCNEYYTTRQIIERYFSINSYPCVHFYFHYKQASLFTKQAESVLMKFGYSVRADGPSTYERHALLSRLITFKILDKYDIENFIQHLINYNGKRANMEHAVEKWESDLEFLKSFNIKSQRSIYIENLKIKYKGRYI